MASRVLAILIFALVVVLAVTEHGDAAVALAVVGIGALLTLKARARAAR